MLLHVVYKKCTEVHYLNIKKGNKCCTVSVSNAGTDPNEIHEN